MSQKGLQSPIKVDFSFQDEQPSTVCPRSAAKQKIRTGLDVDNFSSSTGSLNLDPKEKTRLGNFRYS